MIVLLTSLMSFSLWDRSHAKRIGKEFLLALGLAILLSSIFLVPFAHFFPHFAKLTDVGFSNGQPLKYFPLNLIIDDVDFFWNESLHKIAFPAVFINYIGWLPVLFAIYALFAIRKMGFRRLLFLLLPIGILTLLSTSTFIRYLAIPFPKIMSNFRYPSLFFGLAVPLILALAGWGLDRLLKSNWPSYSLKLTPKHSLSYRAFSLPVVVLLLWSVRSVYDFSQTWLKLSPLPAETTEVVQAFESPSTQWVEPTREHYWFTPLLENGSKLTNVNRPWTWSDNETPPPFIQAVRADEAPEGASKHFNDFWFVHHPENEYASVTTKSGIVPCRAEATGGNIDVYCQTSEPGYLDVRENSWAGWKARVDGIKIELEDSQWLRVGAPSGTHTYTFRFRPWDVILGIILSAIGSGVLIWLWLKETGGSSPATSRQG
jgi:hypothetical protein